MKHIKNFTSLNESYQDGVELIDAIKNTPEGRDFQKIVLGHSFDTSFDLKRTGRVYLTNYGSKTSVERIANGRYSITSLSNGVPFWTEYYDNIPELLRGAWSNAVAKRISGSGMKKEDIRNWVLANIPIGSELSAVEILNSYTEKNSIEFLDANEIENTEIIRKLQRIFLNDDVIKIEDQYRPPRAKLKLDLGNTVLSNIFGFDSYGTTNRTRGTIFLDIIPVSNDSKNSLKVERHGGSVLKLKKSSDLNSDLEGFILKFIKLSVKTFTPYDFVGDKTELDIAGLIISAIEGGSVDTTYQLIEDYLEKIGKLGDPSFPKAMNAISKSTDEKILELHKRLAEKYAATLRGIGIASRFGAFE
jgi:hypothetical protein